MRRSIRHWLTRLEADGRGNIAAIVGIGMPALIGAAGLAVDISQWYVWKRELQHSVDQAAISAAWARTQTSSKETYKARALQEFNANQNVTKDFTTAPAVRLANFAGGNANSVIVTATASKMLPFSGFLMGRAAQVTAYSQARFAEGGQYNACLVATSAHGTGLDIGGNADVKAQCGLAALSCDAGAVEIDGSATVKTDSIATCGTANVPPANEDVVTENLSGLKDIYADLPAPDNPVTQTYSCPKKGVAAPVPGTYKGGITVKCTTVFNGPGIYVIDGGDLDLAGNYNVTGNGVMFVLKNGARIKFGGSGNGNKISLTPMVAAQIPSPYSTQADRYAGVLVFERKDNNPGSPGHQLNGNSQSLVEGLIYLPSGEMTVNGTADVASQCLQITAYKIHIKGNASLETLCPTKNATSVGGGVATVRLVA